MLIYYKCLLNFIFLAKFSDKEFLQNDEFNFSIFEKKVNDIIAEKEGWNQIRAKIQLAKIQLTNIELEEEE